MSEIRDRRVRGAWGDRLRVLVPPLVLALWALLVLAAPGSFSDRDLTMLQTVLLVAVLGWVFIYGVVQIAGPRLTDVERRSILWLLRAVFVLPLSASLVWAAQGVLLPVPVRGDGEVPNLVALLGQNERGVARALGRAEEVADPETAARGRAIVPAPLAGARLVVYALPDLQPAEATSPEESARARFLEWLDPSAERQSHDARVFVFFSPTGRAVTAHLDVDRSLAESLLAPAGLDALPARVGLGDSPADTDAPSWAKGVYATPDGALDRWGRSDLAARPVDFRLRSDAPTAPLAADDLVSLTVGTGLAEPLPVATAVPVSTLEVDGEPTTVEGHGPTPGATSDYADRTFWVVILGTEKTEADAWRRADALNERAVSSGGTGPAATVERSGHLQGIGDDDFWVVVHTVGFDDRPEASKVARSLSMELRVLARTARVRKMCGSFTFVSIDGDAAR